MSDELKKPSGGLPVGKALEPKISKPPGPLPGAMKPGGAPLPGAKRMGAALPGLGAKRQAATPFMKPVEKPVAPKVSVEQIRRDPFATSTASAPIETYGGAGAMVVPGADERIGAAAAKSKMSTRQKAISLGVALGLLIIGFGVGSVVAGRVEDAIMIRDARIIQIEVNKLNALFAEVDGALTKAYQDAKANKFDKGYLKILAEKLQGNPFNPSLFTDRNYKNFDPATVEALHTYYDQWTVLYTELGKHFRATDNDDPQLSATGEEFTKLLEPRYGVVFTRDEEGNGALIGNLVVLGKSEEKDGKIATQIQYEVGTYGDSRTFYNGPAGDSEFSKNAEGYVIAVEPQAEGGLLKDATQPHFAQYTERLKELTDILARMREAQSTVKAAIDKIAAESPPSLLTGMSVDDDVEEYKVGAAKAAAGISEEAPAEGEKPAE
ncbi:MAG: hypothetical protein M0R80_19830 [Proteobacteria bacterium]|nr:hypothetical protein [Pseudomonadota bacterium]